MFIGVDLGTSAVKLLLMDSEGNVKKITSKEYPVFYPFPGWSEQNPADWWKAVTEGIIELTEGFDRSAVRGISFGGQMHGLVALDSNDNVIRPAILWNDGRTSKETDWLNNEIGRSRLSKLTGNIAFAGFTAPKLLWMKANEPENYKKISKIMLPKDYIAYMMTGVHSCDYSDASGMLLLDVEHKCWSKEMCEICGVDEAWLPKLFESSEITGKLKTDVAKVLMLSEDVIVAAGAGDNAAAAVGTGCVGAGKCNISLGTSGTVFITNDCFRVDSKNALHSFAHADGSYHLMGCMLSAASCNNWWMKDILGTTDFAGEQKAIEKRADEGKLGENRVFFLPYLSGERSPHNDPFARGAFIGMAPDTDRADMLQAVFEGVAFGLRDSLEVAKSQGIVLEKATVCGGGGKSPLWRRILADVLNMKLETVEIEEGPAYGGAILAAVAAGCFESVEAAAKKVVKVSSVTEPDTAEAAKYEEAYKKFVAIYPALKSTYAMLANGQ